MKSVNNVIAFIKETAEEISLGRLKRTEIGDEASILAELSLDSLDYATIVVSCEQFSGVKVMDREIDWGSVHTVRQLASLFCNANA